MEALKTGYDRFLGFCGLIAGISIAAVAVMVTLDVVLRNLGIGNFPWLIEVVEYELYVATFLATPWVLHQGAHVRVDLLPTLLPPPVARALEVLTDVIGTAISSVLFYYGLAAATDAFDLGSMIFKELVVAEWWLLSILPLSAAMLTVEFLRRLYRVFRGRPPTAPETPVEGGGL